MRALCVRQPWAELIASGKKTIELRTWYIKPGPLAIVASKTRKVDGLPTGVVVAVVDVADCRDATPADSEAASFPISPDDDFYAIVLTNAVRTRPLPVKGRLGLFEVDLEQGCEPEPVNVSVI